MISLAVAGVKGLKSDLIVRKRAVRCLASNMLSLLKKHYTYERLSKESCLPTTVLCRYVRGAVIPNYDRAIELYGKLKPMLLECVKEAMRNNHSLLYSPQMLDVLSTMIVFEVAGQRVTKILAFNDAQPLAVATSLKIDVPFIVISEARNMNCDEWYTIEIKKGDMWLFYHVPKIRLKKTDSLLFIDVRHTEIKREVLKKLETEKKLPIGEKVIVEKLIGDEDLVDLIFTQPAVAGG